MDNVEPIAMLSNAESPDPKRALERTEKDDPK
jgi:hypothetical protein